LVHPSGSPLTRDNHPQTSMQYCRVYARLQSDVRKVREVSEFLVGFLSVSPPKCGLVVCSVGPLLQAYRAIRRSHDFMSWLRRVTVWLVYVHLYLNACRPIMPRYRCPQCAYALSKEKRMFFCKDLSHCRAHWGFHATSFAAGRLASGARAKQFTPIESLS
jgi:hypothetical protein